MPCAYWKSKYTVKSQEQEQSRFELNGIKNGRRCVFWIWRAAPDGWQSVAEFPEELCSGSRHFGSEPASDQRDQSEP